MSPHVRAVLCGILAVSVAVCASAGSAGLNQALTKRLEMFESAFVKQNATAAAAFFTSYGVFLSADYAPFVGQIGVENALQGLMAEGTMAMDLELQYATVITDDPFMAYSICSYVKHGAQGVMDTGHSSFVWVLVDEPVEGSVWKVLAVSSASNKTSSMPLAAPMVMKRPLVDTVAPHSNLAAIEAAQTFFNQFTKTFNAKGSASDYAGMLSSDVTIFTKDAPQVTGSAEALGFLTKALPAKGYAFASSVVVEAGAHSSDLFMYARGAMSFFDQNGSLLSANNFLCLMVGTASASHLTLASLSVTPTADF